MTFDARTKLNAFHIMGSLGLAAVVAAITGSSLLFVLIAIALIAAGIATGQIRMDR